MQWCIALIEMQVRPSFRTCSGTCWANYSICFIIILRFGSTSLLAQQLKVVTRQDSQRGETHGPLSTGWTMCLQSVTPPILVCFYLRGYKSQLINWWKRIWWPFNHQTGEFEVMLKDCRIAQSRRTPITYLNPIIKPKKFRKLQSFKSIAEWLPAWRSWQGEQQRPRPRSRSSSLSSRRWKGAGGWEFKSCYNTNITNNPFNCPL